MPINSLIPEGFDPDKFEAWEASAPLSDKDWILKTFGAVDADDLSEIKYGSKGSLSFRLKDGVYMWFSHELNRGGDVASLRRRGDLVDRLRQTASGFGRPISSVKWALDEFEAEVWAKGEPVDQSDLAKEYLESRGLATLGLGKDIVRRVPYVRADGMSDGASPALCWRKEDGTYQLRFLFGDYSGRATVGSSTSCIVLPGSGEPLMCEGVEDGIALQMATGRTVWVTCGDMENRELPEIVDAVTVVFDNDIAKSNPVTEEELGKKMDRTIRWLQRVGINRVSFTLPVDCKDVNELLQRGGIEAVEGLVEAAIVGEPKRPEGWEFVDLNRLAKDTLATVPWLIEDFLPAGGACSMAGASNAGKTNWTALFVACAASGRMDILGCEEAEPFPVVWVSNEEPTLTLKSKLQAAILRHDIKAEVPIVVRGNDVEQMVLVSKPGFEIEPNEQAITDVIDVTNEIEAGLVIFDPFNTLQLGLDQNSAAVGEVNKILGDIRRRTGAATLHIHHTPKERNKEDDWYVGTDSTAWMGATAIYSTLDLGIVFSRWLPRADGDRKRWKQMDKLETRRWVYTSLGKSRGMGFADRMYRIEGYELSNGQEHPVLVPVTDADANALLREALSDATDLINNDLNEIIDGSEGKLIDVHKRMKGRYGWPSAEKLQATQIDAIEVLLEGSEWRVQRVEKTTKKHYNKVVKR